MARLIQQFLLFFYFKITNDVDCVLNIQALELNAEDNVVSSVLHQLQRVVKERDAYAQV